MKIQKRVKGGRQRVSSSMFKSLDVWVRAQARRDGVSVSFTLANLTSYVSGIPIEDIRPNRPKLVRKRA